MTDPVSTSRPSIDALPNTLRDFLPEGALGKEPLDLRSPTRFMPPTPDETGPLLLMPHTDLLVLAHVGELSHSTLVEGLETVWALAQHRQVRPWVQFYDEKLLGEPQRCSVSVVPRPPLARSGDAIGVLLDPAARRMAETVRGRPFQMVVLTRYATGVSPPWPPFRDGPAVRCDLVVVRGLGFPSNWVDGLRQNSPRMPIHGIDEVKRQVERLDLVRTMRDEVTPATAPSPVRPRL